MELTVSELLLEPIKVSSVHPSLMSSSCELVSDGIFANENILQTIDALVNILSSKSFQASALTLSNYNTRKLNQSVR